MANPLRGEAELTIGGETFLFRPSFQAILEIEAEIGPLFALALAAGEGKLGFRELDCVLWHCLSVPAGSQRPPRKIFGEKLLEAGAEAGAKTFRALMMAIFAGTPGHDGPLG